MPKTTPWLFYQFFVLPNYSEFDENSDDIRLGFNASVAAFQQADIFYAYYRRHDPSIIARWPRKKDLLTYLGERDPHFITIQSVTTVYKHLYTTQGHYDVGSPMAVWGVVHARNQTEISMKWGNGEGDYVVVRRKDGTQISLKTALKTVVCDLWPAIIPDDYGGM